MPIVARISRKKSTGCAATRKNFPETLSSPKGVGRKLDFLTQELHREINTVASKAGVIEITKWSGRWKVGDRKAKGTGPKCRINIAGYRSWESPGTVVNVGHGNFVVAGRIIAILESGSLPSKRMREKATEDNLLVDATAGRKTRSLVVTDSRHVILSALWRRTRCRNGS